MKILLLHNAYQHRGGEDTVVDAEAALLRSAGHEVHVEIVSNHSIQGAAAKAKAFINTPYDPSRATWTEELVKVTGAQVVHVHNFFPLLTPAVHVGASRAGAAVVQTLHNYRLLCGGALFLRNGKVCEKCLDGSKAWSVVHRCYRGSLPGSLALARMQWRSEQNQTWSKHVHRFIALTDFARGKFIQGGIPADRLVVKPNFVDAPAPSSKVRAGALFVGRLSEEKGVHVLLDAWRGISDHTLSIIGDGPERERLVQMAPANVRFLGLQQPEGVREAMERAQCLIIPSLWYEGFPMTVVESYAAALPVLASRIGSLSEIIDDHETGRLFSPGNATELRSILESGFANGTFQEQGARARQTFEKIYTPKDNLSLLLSIYEEAITLAAGQAGSTRRKTVL